MRLDTTYHLLTGYQNQIIIFTKKGGNDIDMYMNVSDFPLNTIKPEEYKNTSTETTLKKIKYLQDDRQINNYFNTYGVLYFIVLFTLFIYFIFKAAHKKDDDVLENKSDGVDLNYYQASYTDNNNTLNTYNGDD
jgi:hypothetical protein